MLRVLFFGELKDVTECEVWIPEMTENTEFLVDFACNRWPGLKNKTFVLAVNKQVVHNKSALQEGDEVAFLPPFSGG